MKDSSPPTGFALLRSIGPAIITASVVLGPGSILAASKIGYDHGYQMVWALALAIFMMVGMTALSARLGVLLDSTLCDELARRTGRWASAICGVAIFLIAACFQFGNNTGVIASIEPFFAQSDATRIGSIAVVVVLNLLVVIALFWFRELYRPVERLMKLLVTLMIIGFASNLILARPDLLQLLFGLVPQLPEGAAVTLLPRVEESKIVDQMTPVTAMFATTFSIAAAFYQSYLVRQKGWRQENLRQGFVDSTIGICVLGLVTLMIMATAAAVLHDNPNVGQLRSAGDVAVQLEPLFGPSAKILFCIGIFAGAFSSFLVNAMIGGTVLSDGLGLGGDMDGIWPRRFTLLVLITGMLVAIGVLWTKLPPVNLIIFAQAITVLALPALALAMLYLGTRGDLPGERGIPLWLKVIAGVALVLVTFLAVRTAVLIYLKLTIS